MNLNYYQSVNFNNKTENKNPIYEIKYKKLNLPFKKDLLDLDWTNVKTNFRDYLSKIYATNKKSIKNISLASIPNMTTFRLPSNLSELESMNCLHYLSKYVTTISNRQKQIQTLFNKYKSEDSFINIDIEDFILRNDLIKAIREFHGDQLKSEKIELLLEFLGLCDLDETKDTNELEEEYKTKEKLTKKFKNVKFNYREFQGLCLFSEKFF